MDTQPLMRALAKLVSVNNPDKILFVGEALVGNEAVDQLTKFDRALRDFSGGGASKGRGIDGMLVTKWDTVDDKVGFSPVCCAILWTLMKRLARL
jgi:signal recognition particle receptor subunit alpha